MLIEEYEELDALRSRSFFHVRLMDIDRALNMLRTKEKQAVLLCGIVGLTERTAGVLIGVNQSTMHRRYQSGLASLARYLNSGGQLSK